MRRILFAGVASFCMASPAAAQEVEDVQVILSNLGPASEVLVDGLTNTVQTLAETQSAVETFAAGGDMVELTGGALVDGTSLGQLSLAFMLNNGQLQAVAAPYLELIDDPSAESLEAAFNPDDIQTIVDNLEPAQEALLEGDGFGGGANGNGLRAAAIELLQGNLGEPGFFGPTDGAASFTLTGLFGGAQTLTAGTNYSSVAQLAAINGIVIGGASGPVLDLYNDPFPTALGMAEPVTAPIIDAIAEF